MNTSKSAADILASVEIASTPPVAGVEPAKGEAKAWPHVSFKITLSRNGREFWSGPYRFGIGHFRPTAAEAAKLGSFYYAHKLPAGADSLAAAWARKPYADFRDKELTAAVAVEIAKMRKFAPTVEGVFLSILSDGAAYFDAQTFEEWAGDLGFSPDSISARAIFDECDRTGRAIARAFADDELAVLREWGYEQ